MKWGNWTLTIDELDVRTLEFKKAGYYYPIKLSRIRNSASMLDWIFQLKHKDTDMIGPQEMYDFLTALDDIFKPQANICSGGNDHVIEPMGQ